jgi:hypothetical protein
MCKQNLWVILIVVILSGIAFAQDTESQSSTSIGMKFGSSITNWSGNEIDVSLGLTGAEKNSRPGFGGGIVVSHAFGRSFAAQVEILYLMKGAKFTLNDSSLVYKLNYLEFPVTIHYAPRVTSMIGLDFFAGSYFDALVTAKKKFGERENFMQDDIKKYYQKTDFGITFGLGGTYKIYDGTVLIDVRYDMGISKIFKEVDGAIPDIQNNGLFFMIGYRF